MTKKQKQEQQDTAIKNLRDILILSSVCKALGEASRGLPEQRKESEHPLWAYPKKTGIDGKYLDGRTAENTLYMTS